MKKYNNCTQTEEGQSEKGLEEPELKLAIDQITIHIQSTFGPRVKLLIRKCPYQ